MSRNILYGSVIGLILLVALVIIPPVVNLAIAVGTVAVMWVIDDIVNRVYKKREQ